MKWTHLKSRDSRKRPAANILRGLRGLGANRGRVTNMSIRGPVLVAGTIKELIPKNNIPVFSTSQTGVGPSLVVMDVAGDAHVVRDGLKVSIRTWARVLQVTEPAAGVVRTPPVELFLISELDESAATR